MSKTLRQMAGIGAPRTVDPGKTAVLLVDFQKEYYSGALPIPDGEAAVANAAEVVNWADRVGAQVVHVHHVAPSAKSPLFTPGTERIEPHTKVQPKTHHHRITKTLPSSFVGTGLDAWLKEHGIDTLVICGLMTHMCVDSTARDAVSLGYKPIVVSDACATRDLPGIDGEPLPARALQRASLTALSDRFADILDKDAVMHLGVQARG